MNYKISITAIVVGLFWLGNVEAGNKDRIGQAGSQELLINPWVRSAGLHGANTANMTGLESMNFNVAGLAFVNKTEIQASGTNYLGGSGTTIGAFGLGQRVGESGVMGLTVTSFSFGDIPVTTVEQPDGGLGNFSPQFLNLGLAYARSFSNSIYGGFVVRSVTQALTNVRASAVCFDAGIRYVTGPQDNLKFGIALRNIGPKMSFNGDGLDLGAVVNDIDITLTSKTEAFEMPAILNLGASYDFYLDARKDSAGTGFKSDHRLTVSSNFMSNSFGKDIITGGFEYAFMEMFMVRTGLNYEEGIFSEMDRTTVLTGLAAGFTVQIPLGSNGAKLGLDYSYRDTNPFSGIHSVGLRLNL